MISGFFFTKSRRRTVQPFHKLSHERRVELQKFTKGLSIKFSNLAMLDLAFHHRSVTNEQSGPPINNERLEFLGDSILGMCTATYLYELLPGKPEGELSRVRSIVVSEQTLSGISLDIGIDQLLVLGKGEERSGGRQKKAILADALEAFIGAYFLDSGFASVDKLMRALILGQIQRVTQGGYIRDYKSLLQEFYQKKYKQYPDYQLVKKIGPEHDRTFMVSVRLNGSIYGPEPGKSKKEAEQAAARTACEALGLSGILAG
ncbi:MAG: ribonuclease III [Spirochaetaceae bacterium]|jgi:ribonuclease-3|nr:ribonuclease III [Spirochaetaceae bacterium]